MSAMTTAIGWRVFSVDDGGALIPPFVRRYWRDREQPRDVWQPGTNRARCFDADHDAPDQDCTCGFRATLVLKELLAAVASRSLARPGRFSASAASWRWSS